MTLGTETPWHLPSVIFAVLELSYFVRSQATPESRARSLSCHILRLPHEATVKQSLSHTQIQCRAACHHTRTWVNQWPTMNLARPSRGFCALIGSVGQQEVICQVPYSHSRS
jgi:hypothetical protein